MTKLEFFYYFENICIKRFFLLKVRFNNEKSRDYTNPLLPTEQHQQSQNGSQQQHDITLMGSGGAVSMMNSGGAMSNGSRGFGGFMSGGQGGMPHHGGMPYNNSQSNINGMGHLPQQQQQQHPQQQQQHQGGHMQSFQQIQQGLIGAAPNLLQQHQQQQPQHQQHPGQGGMHQGGMQNMVGYMNQNQQNMQMGQQQMNGAGM